MLLQIADDLSPGLLSSLCRQFQLRNRPDHSRQLGLLQFLKVSADPVLPLACPSSNPQLPSSIDPFGNVRQVPDPLGLRRDKFEEAFSAIGPIGKGYDSVSFTHASSMHRRPKMSNKLLPLAPPGDQLSFDQFVTASVRLRSVTEFVDHPYLHLLLKPPVSRFRDWPNF